jgi:WD40 repeat protein
VLLLLGGMTIVTGSAGLFYFFLRFSISVSLPVTTTDRTIRMWNSITGELRLTRCYHTSIVTALALHPLGSIFASGLALAYFLL